MKLKKTCNSFAGVTFSLSFTKHKLFTLFMNSLNEAALSFSSISYEDNMFNSLSELKSIYKTGTSFSITTQAYESFLRIYGTFHNQYNSEKSVSSYDFHYKE